MLMMNRLRTVAMFKCIIRAHGKSSIVLVKACEQYVHTPDAYEGAL